MNRKAIFAATLGLLVLTSLVVVWRTRSSEFRPDQNPALLGATGEFWLFEASDSGDGFTRRQCVAANPEFAQISDWIERQTGWTIDNSALDPYHGTAIAADVYSIKIRHDRIFLHYAKVRGDIDDDLVTIGRPLSDEEWRFLDSIVAKIIERNPASSFVRFSKDEKNPMQ